MFYRFALTVPAGTTAADPVTLDCKMVRGIVHRVELVFRDGCVGMVSVRIRDMDLQVWPTNTEEAFAADGEEIKFDEEYEIVDPTGTLVVEGWAPNTLYDHTIVIRFGVRMKKRRWPWESTGGVWSRA